MKRVLLLILFLSCQLLIFATPIRAVDGEGGLPGYFVDLGAGARPLAMGRAFVGLADDINSIYWNPAGLTQLDKYEISTMYVSLFEETNYNFLGYAHPILHQGVVGGSLFRLYTGDIDGRDENNYPTETYSVYHMAFFGSYGRKILSDLSVGCSLKFMWKDIAGQKANNLSADLSFFYYPIKHISFGLNLQNLLSTKYKGKYAKNKLPIESRIGTAIHLLDNRLLITGDVNKNEYKSIKLHFGMEYNLFNILFPRLGYDIDRLVCGSGIRYKEVQIDYAFANLDLGYTHRISVSYKFGLLLHSK